MVLVVGGGMSWQRVLAYNALAFALQFPLGGMLDVRPRLVKGMFVASLAMTLAGNAVLSLMYDKSGKASGTAFGLNGLALFTGSL